jgi:hypothetical protein
MDLRFSVVRQIAIPLPLGKMQLAAKQQVYQPKRDQPGNSKKHLWESRFWIQRPEFPECWLLDFEVTRRLMMLAFRKTM